MKALPAYTESLHESTTRIKSGRLHRHRHQTKPHKCRLPGCSKKLSGQAKFCSDSHRLIWRDKYYSHNPR